MSDRDDALLRAFEAAELRVYAGVTGDPALTRAARHLPAEGGLPDAETRQAAVEADPVSAAGLGWLAYPELLRTVSGDPGRYLSAEEADAFAGDASTLRLVVLARVEGRLFGEVRAEHGAGRYALAARGDESARRIWALLEDQGLLDDDGFGDGDHGDGPSGGDGPALGG